MFTFHVLGLCVCVHGPNSLDILMLNSLGPAEPIVPYHLPGLFAERRNVRRSSLRQMPSVYGRFNNALTDGSSLGWDLTGLIGDIDGSAPPEMVKTEPANPRHPDVAGNAPDWSSLHWVLSAERAFPDANLQLLPNRRTLGRFVNSIVRFRGGRVQGGRPFSPASNFVWHVRDDYEQAFTDVLDVVYEGSAPTMEFLDLNHQTAGSVAFEGDGEAWLVNEAPERLQQAAALAPVELGDAACPDVQIFASAFGPQAATQGLKIRATDKLIGDIFERDFCVVTRFEDRR